MVDLKVDFCSYKAAKYACENWHYSKCVPNQKTVKIGAWEDNKFIGCVIFGDGANAGMFKPYGLSSVEGCELVRVALNHHKATVTKIAAIAIKFLRKKCPKIKLILSFADPEQGHVGGMFQGGNWLYLGMTTSADEYLVNGVRMHGRALRSTRSTHKKKNVPANNVYEWGKKVLDPNIQKIQGSSKYRYAYPLDRKIARQLRPLALPYPKRPADD